MLPKIPVVDLSKEDLKPGSGSWLLACNQVCHALEEYGSFVAVYSKFSFHLTFSLGSCNRVFESTKELFDLPKKIKILNDNKKPYRGYIEKSPHFPLHEVMRIDNVTTFEETQKLTKLMWPNENDPFRQNFHSYSKLVEELNELGIRMVFECYGVEEYCNSHIKSTSYHLRLLKYEEPRCTC
ncbi:hypothetical protein Patl1_34375 [Pistacia atlantica]|uniref:Uncharacterized protein n=1 Tax=Pistacia atlantica TaxID=434234 RepID=A0ACC0ZWC0_9ROSI|nr:hypothetical protein Patl1_34375 [Pistacia atlantica]